MKTILFKIYGDWRQALSKFFKDDGFLLAAALAFFAMLSLIPLGLIAVSFIGHFLGHEDQIFNQISTWLQETIPSVKPEFILFLRQLVDKRLESGLVGLVFLLFVASFLFSSIESILEKIFARSKKRNFWHSRLLAILLIILTVFLFFIPTQLNWLFQYFSHQTWLSWIFQWFVFFKGSLIYFVGHGLLFFLLLTIVPHQNIRKRQVFWGALHFSLMTLLARGLFRFYMGWALDRYHFIYGSLTVLVMLILWIYYLSAIFIICSELVSVIQEKINGDEAL